LESCYPDLVLSKAALLLSLVSCACSAPVNPSFQLSIDDANRALAGMGARRVPLERPLVVIAGYNDPGIAAPFFKKTFGGVVTNPQWVVDVTPDGSTFDEFRKQLLDAVDRAFGGGETTETIEVDVVALSMGGLVARYAAVDDRQQHRQRLKIARLFTLSTPHRGAKLAWVPTFSAVQKDMRPGSQFLKRLPHPDYPVYAYARLGDNIVGEENAAMEGQYPWWVANRPMEDAHLACYSDPRLLADIARRLRNEPGYATWPPTAFPK